MESTPYTYFSASPTIVPRTHSTTHSSTKTTFDNQPPIPECLPLRDTPQYFNSDSPPSRPHRPRYRGPNLYRHNHHLAQHWCHSRGHQEDILPTTLPRRATQQGQQAHMGSPTRQAITSSPTTNPAQSFTTNPFPPRHQIGHSNSTILTIPTQRRLGAQRLTVGNHRVHQLRQRRPNQPREHRRIPTVHRIPRHPQQISLLLPSQDLQRGHLSLPSPASSTILHQPRFQTSYPPQRLLHNLPLS